MAQRTQFFPLQGGLDLVTPAIATAPGRVIAGQNYEPVERGYQRVDGYERYDGRPKPSEASYWVLPFVQGTAAIGAGDVVVGGASGASGEVLVDALVESGSFAGGDAAGRLVLTAVAGEFQAGEALEILTVQHALADGAALERGAATDAEDAAWLQAAIETARADIEAVPGGGPVRGVWVYDGEVYAFRDDAASGASECRMYKATSLGWQQQDLGIHLDFDSGGTYEIQAGDTVTGAASGATATVLRVAVRAGAWSTGDATGTLVLADQAGTFQAENLDVGANANVATVAGDSQASRLEPGGRFAFVNHNFFGAASLSRMYGVDGKSHAFEWDGSVFVPIKTGMAADAPVHIGEHRNHLFLAYPGGSLQHSSTGAPYRWEVITGAAELGIGEEVTGLLSNVSGALVVFARNSVSVLQGDDTENWVLRKLADDAGAVAHTAQRIGTPVYLDDRGLRSLETTQRFGDFNVGTVTRAAEPLIRSGRRAPCGSPPPTPPCVRFRTRRFMKRS